MHCSSILHTANVRMINIGSAHNRTAHQPPHLFWKPFPPVIQRANFPGHQISGSDHPQASLAPPVTALPAGDMLSTAPTTCCTASFLLSLPLATWLSSLLHALGASKQSAPPTPLKMHLHGCMPLLLHMRYRLCSISTECQWCIKSSLSKSVKLLSLLPWRGAGPALYISPYLDTIYSHTVRDDSGAGTGAPHFYRLFREVDN